MPQAVAASLAECSAKNQRLTANVGDFSAADRCYLSVPLTQAHFRQGALPKKSVHRPNRDLVSANSGRQRPMVKHCRYRRYVELTHILCQRTLHMLVSYCFTYISGFKCTFCRERQLDKKHNTLSKHQIPFLLSMQKAEVSCLILKLQTTKKKRQIAS